MALAALSDVKAHLGLADDYTAEDTRLTAWLNAAIAGITAACSDWDFETTTRTEYYQPNGRILVLKKRPVQSITSVYEDHDARWGDGTSPYAAATLLTAGTDYALERDGSGLLGEVSRSGNLRRIGKPWAQAVSPIAYANTNYNNLVRAVVPAVGAVKVVYVSGYTTVPANVTTACCFEVDEMRLRAKRGGKIITSESLGEYSYSAQNIALANQPYGYFLSASTPTLLAPYLAGTSMRI